MKLNLIIIIFSFFTISIFAQRSPDRHSTVSRDSWISCTTSANPNAERGNSHWLMFDFGIKYKLGESKFWNYNHPDNLNYGIQNYAVDISNDGVTWTKVGEFMLPQANASGFYEGSNGPDFNDLIARYLLITPQSNYGGSCYAISELKIDVQNAPLPVDFVKVGLECIDNKTKVNWEVASEVNVSHYEIQFLDTDKVWNTVARKKAVAQNESSYKYSHEYNMIAEQATIWRVKSVDFDGLINFSDQLNSDCYQDSKAFTLSPNPATDFTNLTTNKEIEGYIKVDMLDFLGKLVSSQDINIEQKATQKLNLANVPAGVYTFNILYNGQEYSYKLVKGQ